jgi:hypothetical protein
MPITYRYDRAANVVFTTGSGVLTDEDLAAHAQMLFTDQAVPHGARELMDFREASRLAWTTSGIRTAVALAESLPQPVRIREVSIVVNSDAAYGVSRVFAALVRKLGPMTEVFRSMDDAFEHLG